jgi:hypothetical protein
MLLGVCPNTKATTATLAAAINAPPTRIGAADIVVALARTSAVSGPRAGSGEAAEPSGTSGSWGSSELGIRLHSRASGVDFAPFVT